MDIGWDEKISLIVQDENLNTAKGRHTPILALGWHIIVATYDGRGGDSANEGINIYVDGIKQVCTYYSTGTYSRMYNGTTPVHVSTLISGTGIPSTFFKGDICQVWLEGSLLSDRTVWDMFMKIRGYVNI